MALKNSYLLCYLLHQACTTHSPRVKCGPRKLLVRPTKPDIFVNLLALALREIWIWHPCIRPWRSQFILQAIFIFKRSKKSIQTSKVKRLKKIPVVDAPTSHLVICQVLPIDKNKCNLLVNDFYRIKLTTKYCTFGKGNLKSLKFELRASRGNYI